MENDMLNFKECQFSSGRLCLLVLYVWYFPLNIDALTEKLVSGGTPGMYRAYFWLCG